MSRSLDFPRLQKTLIFAGIGLLLCGWFFYEWFFRATNHDIYWLYIGFQRLLDGRLMSESFFETNPPLSVFIYTPAFWLASHDILALRHAVLLYSVSLSAIAVLVTYKTIKTWPFLSDMDRNFIIVAMLLGASLISIPEYGQRDHMIAMALIPVCSVLLSRTWGYRLPQTFIIPVLILGTTILLLKPYYGIVPAFLMLHRACYQRDIKAVFDSDFIIMAIVTAAYVASVFVFFNDYIINILPDLPYLYGSTGARFNIKTSLMLIMFWGFFWSLTGFACRDINFKKLCRLFLIFAALSYLVYILMNKGYAYHLMPFLTFMIVVAALLLRGLIKDHKGDILKTLLIILVFLSAIMLLLPKSYYPPVSFIKSQPITQEVRDCGEGCHFLMLGVPVRIVQHISAYSGKPLASRFSKDWFVEGLLDQERKDPGNPLWQELRLKYADMIAKDIEKWQPHLIYSCDILTKRITYHSISPLFKEQMMLYSYEGERTLNVSGFYYGDNLQNNGMPCSLYKRRQ